MKGTVQPRLSRGLRDLLPEQMLARQRMIATIREVYERYGFVPLETPAIEYLDVLSGSAGQETQQSIFRVLSPEEEPLGLRFDLTVPLARVVSQYPDLRRPFRRYKGSSVWRAAKPDPGGFGSSRSSTSTRSASNRRLPTRRFSARRATRCRRWMLAATAFGSPAARFSI